MALDQINSTKYTSFGVCSSSLQHTSQCGLNTGLYLTLQRGLSSLVGVRFRTAIDFPTRNVITITIEGSNQSLAALSYGSSWFLVYKGPSGLKNVTGREIFGNIQMLSNNSM
jgi:hypothetical protein